MLEEIIKVRKPLEERLEEEVCNVIGQIIGEAAMCWTNVEGSGTFKVEDARTLADELGHYVADLIDKAREEAGDDEAGYIIGEGASLKKPMLQLQIIEKMKVRRKE